MSQTGGLVIASVTRKKVIIQLKTKILLTACLSKALE